MKKNYLVVNNLKVSKEILSFVNNELLKDTNISPEKFWSGFDKAVHELEPKNKELIEIREILQKKIVIFGLQVCLLYCIQKIQKFQQCTLTLGLFVLKIFGLVVE